MRRVLLIVIAVVIVMFTLVAVRLSRLRAIPEEADDPKHVRIPIPQGFDYGGSYFGRRLDISADGTKIVYVAMNPATGRRLFLQTIGEPSPREIPGTDGANDPSFSPDGRYIAFYAGTVKRVTLDTNTVIVIGEAGTPRGMAWLDADNLILSNVQGNLLRLNAAQKETSALFPMFMPQLPHLSPYLVPGNKAVLFTLANGPLMKARIGVIDLKTGEEKQLLDEPGFAPRYVPTGHIVFARGFDRQLMAARFDLNKLEIVGSPIPVLKTALSGLGSGGSTDYSISETGTLVYTLRQEPSIDDVLAHIGNVTLTEIHLQLKWTDELKRLVP